MAAWDAAESAFLTAAAKVYAALGVAHPSGNYGQFTVDINVDGETYSCRCDCTGVIQCIIRVMGYDPNWGVSSVPGHTGDGWYLTDATSSFVKDRNGNISPDWEVLPFDASDARPGDIRAASGHSHCDIFVDYLNGNAYGLNAGSGPNTGGQAIPKSCAAGAKYLQDNDPADLAATWTIQDSDAAKVLRYVNGSGGSSTTAGTVSSGTQSLQSLDIELKFLSKLEFFYNIRNSSGQFDKAIPGYFPVHSLVVDSTGRAATDAYSDSWLEFVPNFTYRYTNGEDDKDWQEAVKAGILMMFTLDNSDPLLYGRTTILHEDGTNDYEASKGWVPLIRTQFPVHFRCVITDVATHTKDYGRSSAYFTNSAADGSDVSISALINAAKNSLFLTDATGETIEAEDARGYLFLHDEDETYDRSDYATWLQGMEE